MSEAPTTGSTIRKVVLVMTLVAIAIAITSTLVPLAYKRPFAILLFYLPILWVAWLGGAIFSVRDPRTDRHWTVLWVLVDFSVLTTFLAFELGAPGRSSQGADLAAFVAFAPVVFPLILAVAALPDAAQNELLLRNTELGSRINLELGQTTTTWLFFSVVAAIQCWLLLGSIRYWIRRRQGGTASRPVTPPSRDH
jgi:hypothetical protein